MAFKDLKEYESLVKIERKEMEEELQAQTDKANDLQNQIEKAAKKLRMNKENLTAAQQKIKELNEANEKLELENKELVS